MEKSESQDFSKVVGNTPIPAIAFARTIEEVIGEVSGLTKPLLSEVNFERRTIPRTQIA